MNIQEQLKSLTDSFKEIKESVLKFTKPAEMKFGEIAAKDADGNETKWTFEGEMLSLGMTPTIDGQPVPDGEYALESGMMAVIEGGALKELADPAEEGQDNEQGYAEKFSAIESKITDFESKFTEVQTTIENLSTVLGKMAEQMGSTLETVSKFAAQSPEPVQKPLNAKEILAQKQSDSLASLTTALKSLKN